MSKRGGKDIHQDSRGFAGVPRTIMDSADYKSLTGNAVKLLLDFAYQYKGDKAKNNGDLSCAYSVLSKRGFNSKSTLQRCKKELLDRDLIRETRKGVSGVGGKRLCSLYAVTWGVLYEQYYPDGIPKHGKAGTNRPLRNTWSTELITNDKKK